MTPPYASTGQAELVLDIFSRINPKKIDSKFIVENNIATASNASTVVNFVKWMGIINEEKEVIPEVSNKLRLIGDERVSFISELIKTAYKDVFEGVNLEQARREDLVNFFIHNYQFGPAPARLASSLLLHLCEKYGIPISEELKKKTHKNMDGVKKVARQRKPNKKIENKMPNKLIEEGVIVLSIIGNGIDKSLQAKTAIELQELYEGEFKSLVTGAKHFFPSVSKAAEELDN